MSTDRSCFMCGKAAISKLTHTEAVSRLTCSSCYETNVRDMRRWLGEPILSEPLHRGTT